MKFKRFGSKCIVRIDKGEEIVETLKKFCQKQKIKLGTVWGLGATNKVVIGLFDVETKEYHSREFRGNYEIAPLYGNISTMQGGVYLHLHINIADKNYQSFGGHLTSAVVSATFEGIVEALDGNIDREFNAETGLNLYKL